MGGDKISLLQTNGRRDARLPVSFSKNPATRGGGKARGATRGGTVEGAYLSLYLPPRGRGGRGGEGKERRRARRKKRDSC